MGLYLRPLSSSKKEPPANPLGLTEGLKAGRADRVGERRLCILALETAGLLEGR